MLAQLANLQLEREQKDEERRQEKKAPKLVTELYPEESLLPCLLRLCHMTEVDDLPILFDKLANATKKVGMELQNKVDILAGELNVPSPQLQVGMTNLLQNLRFEG